MMSHLPEPAGIFGVRVDIECSLRNLCQNMECGTRMELENWTHISALCLKYLSSILELEPNMVFDHRGEQEP